MVAVVIGAAGTIGEACVAQFREVGLPVIAVDLTAPSIDGVTGMAMDVTDRDSVREVLSTLDHSGHISALVYAAGVNTTGPLDGLDWSDYDRVMEAKFGSNIDRSPRLPSQSSGGRNEDSP